LNRGQVSFLGPVLRRIEARLESVASGSGPLRFFARLLGFAVGNQSVAEGFVRVTPEPVPDWLTQHRGEVTWYTFAREAAISSKEGSQAAVASLQTKIAGLQSLLTVVVPAALGVTGATLGQLRGTSGAILFALIALADLALLAGLLLAAMASGLRLALEVSLTRLETEAQPLPSGSDEEILSELRLREIHALHNSAWLAMCTSTVLASDLFAARQYAVMGAVGLGAVLLLAWA